jgi:transcriptional regulator with XRE-family HTH domain/tetratricopeptide (TPR) repeat protein
MSVRSNVTPNTRLRELRRARGFTQQCLADLIQVCLDTERDWEYGRIALPRIRQLKALSDVLGVPMGQLGFAGLGQPVDDAIDLSSEPFGYPAMWHALSILCDDEQVQRRAFTLLTGTALMEPVTQYLAAAPFDLPSQHSRSIQITDELVDNLDGVNGWLRGMDDLVGGGTLLQVAQNQIRLLNDLLNNGTYRQRVGLRLHSSIAELLRLAGWMSFDIGHHAKAQHLWLTALRAAHAAGDHALAAHILGFMAHHAQQVSVVDAVPLAEAARKAYRGNNHAVDAILHMRAAEAHGNLGNLTAHHRAIDACFNSWSKVRSSDEKPPWAYWISERAIHFHAGGVGYYAMGKWTQAQEHLGTALALDKPNYVRDNALCHTMLAISQLAQRDVEQACANANKALDLFGGCIESTQCVNYLNRFIRKLGRFQASPAARQFIERMRSLKTAAA